MRLYIDCDGYFAAVEEQVNRSLRGRPIGVVPVAGAENTCVIAANIRAKAFGVGAGTRVRDARRLCPDIRLVEGKPDLYVHFHHAVVAAVESVIPVDAVHSIDEMSCTPSPRDRPEALGVAIKAAVRRNVGDVVTCSLGFAPGRLLAKTASDMDKPDGLTIMEPESLPGRLLDLDLSELPGIGPGMCARLGRAGIRSVVELWNTSSLRFREIWGGVGGVRYWHALHGYDLPDFRRGGTRSVEHSRVLAPSLRTPEKANATARMLTVKVAKRLRRMGMVAGRFSLSATLKGESKFRRRAPMAPNNTDASLLRILNGMWDELAQNDRPASVVFKVRISLDQLRPESECRPSLFEEPEQRRKEAALAKAMDWLNTRYGRTIVGYGLCACSQAIYTGTKIAFTHIPEERDFL